MKLAKHLLMKLDVAHQTLTHEAGQALNDELTEFLPDKHGQA
jgi:hypothetical protein